MPPKKKSSGGGGGGAPEWMCTFSDMMSLLLCFFVLLFSLSTIEIVKFEQMINSIQGAFGSVPGLYNTSWVEPVSTQPQKVEPVQRTRTLQRAKEAIVEKARSRLVADEQSKEVIVEGVKEGIRFSLAGRVLFDKGSAALTEEGKQILQRVSETLRDFEELRVRIEGHTDPSPISSSIYQDNWRLGQARAFSAMLYLRDECDISEDRLSFMSASQYRPRFPNDTEEGQALNRRIEILLLQGNQSEAITGVLRGSEDPRVAPDQYDFVPQR